MDYENLLINHKKTLTRFENITNGVTVLRRFFDAGYRTKQSIYILLVAHNKKYLNEYYKKKFESLWIGIQHDPAIIKDLYDLMDRINAFNPSLI